MKVNTYMKASRSVTAYFCCLKDLFAQPSVALGEWGCQCTPLAAIATSHSVF